MCCINFLPLTKNIFLSEAGSMSSPLTHATPGRWLTIHTQGFVQSHGSPVTVTLTSLVVM